jgi:23S rRNA (guanosine2251-2'-O)-methyltransferase
MPARARPRADDPPVVAGRRPVLELLRAEKPAEKILIARELGASGLIAEIRTRAAAAAVPLRVVPRSEIDRLAPGIHHQGVVAIVGRYRYAPLEELLARPDPALLFLDGIMDPHNLGSLLRSADQAGFHGVVIPARRAAGVSATVRRVSAGAAEVVPVARVSNISGAIGLAQERGLWIVGLDEDAEVDIWSSRLLEPPVGLVLGAEDRGMSRLVRERCDELVRIPSAGRLSSLNVAVAGAIAMFEVARRRVP